MESWATSNNCQYVQIVDTYFGETGKHHTHTHTYTHTHARARALSEKNKKQTNTT